MSLPIVSVVLPVGYGLRFFKVALTCALTQTYRGPLEIVVLDNSDEDISMPLLSDPRVRIKRNCPRLPVADLRNMGNDMARGDVIVHFDEDDWYAADRIATQVQQLEDTKLAVTGWHNLLYYNTADEKCWRYDFAGSRPYVMGTSLCYWRCWWKDRPFKSMKRGEDYHFQNEAKTDGQLCSFDVGQLAVARAHKDSLCPPRFRSCYTRVERTLLPAAFWTAVTAVTDLAV